MSENGFDNLSYILSKLPGLGPRSAKRVMLYLLKKRENVMQPLIKALTDAYDNIKTCKVCGNFDVSDPCSICQNPKRDTASLCVVQDVADLWALERSLAFRGRYHVLGGLLSAIDGIGPDAIGIDKLRRRILDENIAEIILALPATVDGKTTSHYIVELIKDTEVKISSLAHGVPVGGELDYLDDGTIETAIKNRMPF
ncbi:MAG: recombination mediator RecR [Alphaproteobacteria bacterium]